VADALQAPDAQHRDGGQEHQHEREAQAQAGADFEITDKHETLCER
jgi:hypothetical protein